MYYPEELIEEIRAKNDIVDVVAGYVRLQKKGASHWGLCPFHNEKTPSFSVNGAKQIYHCFGCGAGGNVYTFLMNYENLTFPEAVRMLADRAGVALPELKEDGEARRGKERRARLLEVNREAAKFFYYQLRSPRGEIGYQYLKKRGLSDETIHKFGLGYAGKSGADLVGYLRQKGFEDELILEAGLANYSEKHGMLSQFWNRVMFPIQDRNNRVIGFGGRVMGDGEPKYLNSPETPIFDKRRNLYGLNFARSGRGGGPVRTAPRASGPEASAPAGGASGSGSFGSAGGAVSGDGAAGSTGGAASGSGAFGSAGGAAPAGDSMILCEGYMDVIAMHQAGFHRAVASLGTAFTAEQAVLLKRYTENVYLAYDSDGAGVKAALRAIGILREAGLTGRVINMKPYKDPDEFMKALGREAFEERISQAENSFFFEIRMLEGQFDLSDPEGKTKFHREIARKLCAFSEEMERENYLQAVAEKYYISAGNLRKLVENYAAQTGLAKPLERPKSGVRRKAHSPEENARRAQRLLLTWISDEPGLYGKIKKYISPQDFTVELYRAVAERLFGDLEQGISNPAGIISMFQDEEEQRQAAELFNTNLPKLDTVQEREKALKDVLLSVKKNSYEYFTARMGVDVDALTQVIEGKKALEELARTHISLE